MNKYYVYILSSQRNGTLYIGLTNDLERRILEHKQKVVEGFTAKYNVNQLMYFEEFENANEAALRE
ncbi:MAG: GIY-YIG nuclease family protein, partial [Flavobacteriales bacterium]|nr:GIY-YIG nuclease family protein [Flavobacteriales bacterium]